MNGIKPSVQPIDGEPGIYFNHIGTTTIRDGGLDVVIPKDISFIKPHIDNLNEIFGTSRFLCRDVLDNSECHNVLEPLTLRFHDAIRDFKSISHLTSGRIKRSAWFSGIGTVFKHIIGTLDEDDAIRYNEAINTLQNDENKIASIVKQNILVMNSTIQHYNDVMNKVTLNEAILQISLDKLTNYVSNVTIVTNELLCKAAINEIISALDSSLLTLSFEIEDLVNSVALSNSNILHPSVITPIQLYDELVKNYHNLSPSRHLPIDLNLGNIHKLINISELVCYYIDNKIIFVLRIPLVSSKHYDLYHSIPLPFPHNVESPDSFVTIIPTFKYLALSLDKTLYSSFNDLQICKTVTDQNYICKLSVIRDVNANPICETEIITKTLKSVPHQCDTKFVHGLIDIWQPLDNSKWIFTQSSPSKLSVECTDKVYEINLLGTGILIMPKLCKGYCRNTQLVPMISSNTMNITNIVSSYSIINDSCCNLDKFLKSKVPRISLSNVDLDKLREYPGIVNDSTLVQNLDEIINRKHLVKYEVHYSILLWLLVVSVLVVVSFKLYKLGRTLFHKSLPNNQVPETNSFHNLESPDPVAEESPIPLPRLRCNI